MHCPRSIWRTGVIAIAAIILVLTTHLNSLASPTESITTTPYSIQGSTAQALRQQINQKGPTDPKTGQRFSGYTQWNVRWNYRYRQQGDRCTLTQTRVNTTVTITLPQWNPPSTAPRDLRDRWNRYIRALSQHENGHRDHGLGAGRDILAMLKRFPAQTTCAELETQANAAAQTIIKQYNQRDVDFDRRTNHGATQGAVFP